MAVTNRSSRKNVGSDRAEVSLSRLGRKGLSRSPVIGNPDSRLYLFGDNDTDGSVRLTYTPPGQSYHLEYRHEGSFRDHDIILDEFTLSRELAVTFDRELNLVKTRVF